MSLDPQVQDARMNASTRTRNAFLMIKYALGREIRHCTSPETVPDHLADVHDHSNTNTDANHEHGHQ